MFICNDTYLEQVNQLLIENDTLICAIAFWGRGAEQLFIGTARDGRTLKVICNLQSGATNPDVIAKLLQYAEVKQHDTLHAKVIAGNNKAIVGSANFSSNGLNLEETEQTGWEEAGIVTTDLVEIQAIREWFGRLWDNSVEITDAHIEAARILWKKRRNNRKALYGSDVSILNIPPAELKDRPIYLAIYRSYLSREGEERLQEVREREDRKLSAYEDWENMPEGVLIDLYYSIFKFLEGFAPLKLAEKYN